MRLGATVPTLVLGAALLAPALAEADQHRSSERGRSGYHRSERGHGERYAPRGRYDRGRGYRHDGRGHYKPPRYHGPRYRPYDRPHRSPYYYAPRYYSRPPLPPPVYYAPRPVPYGYYGGPVWGPRRGGVHGGVSVGGPFFGLSLYF